MGNVLSHALTLIVFLPVGYVGIGYPFAISTLVLRGTCTKTSWLSTLRSGRLQYGSGDSGASAARSAAAKVVWWSMDLDVFFIYYYVCAALCFR